MFLGFGCREGFAGMGPRGSGCFRDLGALSLGLEDRFPAVGFRCACTYIYIYEVYRHRCGTDTGYR